MSDNGYDNLKLNDLIKDLESVNDTNSKTKSVKITFKPNLENKDYDNQPPLNHSNYNGVSEKHSDNSSAFIQEKEMQNIQKELTLVRQELALLKRSQSLANHPIFSFEPNKDVGMNQFVKKNSTMTGSITAMGGGSHEQNKSFQSFGSTSNISPSPNFNKFHSLTRLNTIPTYSAHRENLIRIQNSGKPTKDTMGRMSTGSYASDVESFSLKPLGKRMYSSSDSMSSLSKNSVDTSRSDFGGTLNLMKLVRLTKSQWLKLDSSRETCRRILAPKQMGSFVVRIQSEYKSKTNAGMIFELILKVAEGQGLYSKDDYECFEYFSIKEFTESANRGLKLIGYAIEPLFPSLEDFVYRHITQAFGLPCLLRLPKLEQKDNSNNSSVALALQKSKLSVPIGYISKRLSGSLTSLSSIKSRMTVTTYAQPERDKLAVELLFLGKINVGRIYGQSAIRHAVDKSLANGNVPKHCIEVTAHIDSLDGVTLFDNERILFYQKNIPISDIVYCGIDPLHRGLKSEELIANGINNSRIFGLLCQKKKVLIKEQKVFLFSELNPNNLMESVIKFVQKHIIDKNYKQMKYQ